MSLLHGDAGVAGGSRLTEHAGEEVEIILHAVDMPGGIHLFAGKGRIALSATCGSDEIEGAVPDVVGAVFVAGEIAERIDRHSEASADSREDRLAGVGVHRTDDLVGMVMALKHHVDMAILHHGKHGGTEQRRLFVALVVGA